MSHPNPLPAPPGDPAWEITYTRLAQAVRPTVDACVFDLASRFQTIGLGTDTQVTQTPRGLSTFLALVGQRGLLCIVDMTLVDGMATGQGPCAALDIRLLDACGDVVADGLASGLKGHTFQDVSSAHALVSTHMDQAATAVYMATLGHFELLQPVARRA